jgi:hypothetical protein
VALMARIQWLQGFPDQAAASARDAVETARKSRHVLSLGYALCMAGCPVALWTGDLREAKRCTDMLREFMAHNALYSSWGECYEQAVRLRHGTEADVLTAAYIEARVDVSTLSDFGDLSRDTMRAGLLIDTCRDETRWSDPEILRIDAELILETKSADADQKAEAKLLRSLELARHQSVLGFELRSAVSLAAMSNRTGRTTQARTLLNAAYDRFSEGFATNDLVRAKRLIDELR